MVNLKGRNFLTLRDYSAEEIEYLLDLAAKLKKMKKDGVTDKCLEGKILQVRQPALLQMNPD